VREDPKAVKATTTGGRDERPPSPLSADSRWIVPEHAAAGAARKSVSWCGSSQQAGSLPRSIHMESRTSSRKVTVKSDTDCFWNCRPFFVEFWLQVDSQTRLRDGDDESVTEVHPSLSDYLVTNSPLGACNGHRTSVHRRDVSVWVDPE